MDQKQILVVGGGIIGQAIWSGFTSHHDFNVHLIDSDPNHPWVDFEWFTLADDFFDSPVKYLDGIDYLVMAAPVYVPHMVERVVGDCVHCGVSYVDFSEDVHVRDKLTRSFGDTDKIAIMAGCGLAPGMIQVIAQYLTKPFDTVYDIDMNVGSLPVNVSNNLQYHPMWSVDGVVNEYTNPVHVINNGRDMTTNPLEWDDVRFVTIDGVEMESFATSGGLGTMIDTWLGKAQNVTYKTIRYPGHLNCVKNLLNVEDDDIFLRTKDDYDLDALTHALNIRRTVSPVDDRVVIHTVVRGLINGEMRENVYSRDIRSTYDYGRISAIQRTTAGGAIAAILAHNQHQFTGLIRQEDIVDEIMEQTGTLVWAGYFQVGK